MSSKANDREDKRDECLVLRVLMVTGISKKSWLFTLLTLLFLIMLAFQSKALRSTINYQLNGYVRNICGQSDIKCSAIKKRTRLANRSIENVLYSSSTQINSEDQYTRSIISNFVDQKRLPTSAVVEILERSMEQHKILPNIVRLKVPKLVSTDESSTDAKDLYGNFSICGDTHGQFYDVMHIFSDSVGGFPSAENVYLFNGDFVDRGEYSVEVILTLLSLKLSNPSSMHLLRGNHETINMNINFGFAAELKLKYPKDFQMLFYLFQDLFCTLPIAAVVEDQLFVVHGGLGPATSNMTLDQIDQIDRFKDPDYDELKAEESKNPDSEDVVPVGMSELLWSDPNSKEGFKKGARGGNTTTFGFDVTQKFLDKNNLQVLIRSHQMMMKGYEVGHKGRCVTIFSAPDYCGKCIPKSNPKSNPKSKPNPKSNPNPNL
jgi:diadenosine tetraphosphatase ApaH/serine/threonine PP2A family protein phosphatase